VTQWAALSLCRSHVILFWGNFIQNIFIGDSYQILINLAKWFYIIWSVSRNLLLWSYLAKKSKILQDASKESSIKDFIISSWLDKTQGHHGHSFVWQQEKRIAYGGHVFKQIETKLAIFIEDLPLVLPIRFRFIRSQNDDMLYV
jgi:hypothetical protein